jgi:hypothetical protein
MRSLVFLPVFAVLVLASLYGQGLPDGIPKPIALLSCRSHSRFASDTSRITQSTPKPGYRRCSRT